MQLARLNQSDGAAVAVLPRAREGIGGPQLAACREKEEGSAGAVRDAKLAQRVHHRLHAVLVGGHGEHAKGTSSRALLFETLDADFKLQPFINLAVLEVAELFADVIDFGSEPVQRSFDCRKSYVDFRKSPVHVSSQVGEFLMHACEMRSQSRIDNILDLFQIAFVHIQELYHAGAQVRKRCHLDARLGGIDQADDAAIAIAPLMHKRIARARS